MARTQALSYYSHIVQNLCRSRACYDWQSCTSGFYRSGSRENERRRCASHTGVPVGHLFDDLEVGDSLDECLTDFPTVTREQVLGVLGLVRNCILTEYESREIQQMALYEITADNLHKLDETSFDLAGLRERYDLQRLLRSQIEVIAPDTLVIAEEFGDWEESKRRIDLLALDKDANIVVIELKRTDDGGHMELQAVRYAAMVSTMSFDTAVEIYRRYLTNHGHDDDARKAILDFLDWEEPDEEVFAQDVRIVLANFSKELMTAVMWLNERELDIRCIRIIPYQDNGRVLIDVQQVVPLPEAANYIIKIRDKEHRGRQERNERSNLRWKFWQGLLEVARSKTKLHSNISPTEYHWISTGAGIGGVSYNYVIRQHGGTVEVFFGLKDANANKRMFDELHSHKAEIEESFGEELAWERMDGKLGSKLAHYVEVGGYQDPESTWNLAQNAMVDAMIKLERSVKPFVLRIR